MLLPSTWSCQMVMSAGRPEGSATAVQAAAVSVEVSFNLFLILALSSQSDLFKLFLWQGAHASWVVGVAGCLVAYTVLALVVIW